MKKTILYILVSLMCVDINAQAGIQFYAGISNATNENIAVTPDGTSHPGYHFGADARLNSGKMYFVIGLQYHKLDFLAQEEKSFFSQEESINWTKLRIGLGYGVFDLAPRVTIRGKTLLSIDLIGSIPESSSAPFTNYNTGVAGANLGLGIDVFNFTFDIDYEIGLLDAVNMTDGTAFDFITISIGYLL